MTLKPLWERLWENLPVKVLAAGAALILFFFHRIDTVQEVIYTSPLLVENALGLTPADPMDRRIKITVRGAKDAFQFIAEGDLEAYVDLKADKAEGTYRAPIKVLKKGGAKDATDLEITVDPLEVLIKLERKVAKEVPVAPQISGPASKGFELRNWEVQPQRVTVEGPSSHMDRVDRVKTEAIDLRGRTGKFSLRVKLATDDPLLTFPGGAAVEILGEVEEIQDTRLWENLNPQVQNLAPDLAVSGPLPPVSLRIRGRVTVLDDTKPDNLTPNLDLGAFTKPGTYPVSPTLVLPPGLELVETLPRFLDVTLKKKEGP